jgi:hypothetical protein
MEAQNDYIVQEIGEKIYYIEPNFVGGGRNNVPVPLEDLSVYVELRVEYNATYSQNYEANGVTYVLQVKVSNSNTFVSFYEGTSFNGNDVFLSTEGYGNYTIDRVHEKSTAELFGVESIDITYNSYAVPEVTIKFVDIKGAALHAAEELTHDKDGIAYENASLDSRFLSCFYTVPYPRFEMLIKGFYGKPVFYDLTCADLRSSFNSNTGNYDLVVKMVGYSFALISDVNFCSLLAAPLSKFFGYNYWEEQVSKKRFTIDGQRMCRLTELVDMWDAKYATMGEAETKLNEEISGTNLLITKYRNLRRTILGACGNLKDNHSDKVYFDTNNYMLYLKNTTTLDGFTQNAALKKIFQQLQKDIEEDIGSLHLSLNANHVVNKGFWVDLNKRKDKDAFCEQNNIKLDQIPEDCFCEITQENDVPKWIETPPLVSQSILSNSGSSGGGASPSPKTVYVNDIIRKLILQIDNEIFSQQRVLNEKTIAQEQYLNEEIKKTLGFAPTLLNISKICFAHLETFLYMFQKVYEDKTLLTSMKFPKVYTKTLQSGVIFYEESWLGNLGSENRLDVQMVYGLVDGIRNIENIQGHYVAGEEVDNCIPYCCFDLIYPNQTKPQKDGLKKSVLKQRIMNLMRYARDTNEDYMTFEKLGKYDAQCYYNSYRGEDSEALVRRLVNKEIDLMDFQIPSRLKSEYDYKLIYDIKDENIYGKKICKTSMDDEVQLTANEDEAWSSDFFNFSLIKPNATALIVPRAKSIYLNTIKHDQYYCYIEKRKEANVQMGEITNNYNAFLIENNAIWYLLDGNEKCIMKRNQKSGDKYIFYSEFDNNKSANALKVVACHSGMSANEYTIITIRGFKYDLSGRKPKVTSYHPFNIPDESVTLFTQDEYTKLSDICARAYLFLYTFDWGSDYRNIFSNKDNIDNITKIISLVPYYLVLLIGAVSYFNTGNRKSRLYEYINPRHVNETVYNPKNNRQGSTKIPWDEIYYIDVISGLVENFPPFLLTDTSKMFTEWVDTYYKHWDEVFMAEETKKHDEGYNDVQSDLYYATLSIVYEQRTRSGKKIIKKYVRLFNDNHPIVKEMTKQFFKVMWVINMKFVGQTDSNLERKYISGFANQLEKLYEFEIDMNINKAFPTLYTVKDYVNFNIYRYLKQIWDRWIINGKNNYDDWKIENVFSGENKRIHFIDPSYNEVGNLIHMHMDKLVKLIIDCVAGEDLPFLTFLSYMYRDNNCMLSNVQNFINAQDKENSKN